MANGAQPNRGIVDKVLDVLGAGSSLRGDVNDIINTAGQIVGGITSIVGFINMAQKILQLIGVLDTDQTQQQMTQTVQNIWVAVTNEAKKDALVQVAAFRAEVETAWNELRRSLNADSFTIDDLNALNVLYIDKIETTMEAMLGDPSTQLMLFIPAEYAQAPWYFTEAIGWWLVPETVMATPSSTQNPPPFSQLTSGQLRWDYRLFLPVTLELVTVMIAYFKALDPAFRTTGQFHEPIAQLRDFLANFADNMTLCLQWTRDYTLEDDYSVDAEIKPGVWPVGAVDICSGSSVVELEWHDGVITIGPAPIHVWNLNDSVARAAAVRERKWKALYDASGIPALRQLIDQLTELTKVPGSSETVHPSINRYGNRVPVGEGSQYVPPTGVCAGRDFPATIYETTRTIIVEVTRQPKLYSKFAIKYEFYLESYTSTANVQDWTSAIERVPLSPEGGSIDIKVQLYDWIVEGLPFTQGPRSHPSELKQLVSMFAGASPVRRYPRLDPAVAVFSNAVRYGSSPDEPGIAQNYRYDTVTIDYDVEFSDGKASFKLQNHPDQGSFTGLYLVVEETPGGQAEWGSAPIFGGRRVLRSVVDVSMAGKEYHVSPDYFKYRKDCVIKAAALLDRITKLAQVRLIPIPRWDPWQYESLGAYLEAINQVSAELLDEARQ